MGRGLELLEVWRRSPDKFHKFNMGYELLQEFYDGLSYSYLIPFLKSDNAESRSTALSILSEMDRPDEELTQIIVPFLKSEVDIERYNAAEWFDMYSKNGESDHFIYVIELLADSNPKIVKHVASLVFNASTEQLEGAMNNVNNYISHDFDIHKNGLGLLLAPIGNYSEFIKNMLSEKDQLMQIYFAIYCVRFAEKDQSLLDILINNSGNKLTISVAEFGRKLANIN